MRRTKIVPVRWIPDNFDSDWDGVPNRRDCEPFNPNKQDEYLSDKIGAGVYRLHRGYKKYMKSEDREQQMRELDDYAYKFYNKPYNKLKKPIRDKVSLFLRLHKKHGLSWKEFHNVFTVK